MSLGQLLLRGKIVCQCCQSSPWPRLPVGGRVRQTSLPSRIMCSLPEHMATESYVPSLHTWHIPSTRAHVAKKHLRRCTWRDLTQAKPLERVKLNYLPEPTLLLSHTRPVIFKGEVPLPRDRSAHPLQLEGRCQVGLRAPLRRDHLPLLLCTYLHSQARGNISLSHMYTPAQPGYRCIEAQSSSLSALSTCVTCM